MSPLQRSGPRQSSKSGFPKKFSSPHLVFHLDALLYRRRNEELSWVESLGPVPQMMLATIIHSSYKHGNTNLGLQKKIALLFSLKSLT
jgi:hypothetical protein